jgi:hypothetical protein
LLPIMYCKHSEAVVVAYRTDQQHSKRWALGF